MHFPSMILSHAAAPLLGALLLTTPAHAAGATIDVAIDGISTSLNPSGQPLADGAARYAITTLLPGADAVIELLAKPSGAVMLSGTFVLTSSSPAPITVDLKVVHTLDAPIGYPILRSSLGGLIPFGGSIASQPGVPMHELLLDAAATPGLLPAGFSSDGTIGPFNSLFQPVAVGTPVQTSMGQRWRFVLAPGATVALNATLRLDDTNFDIDFSGSIGGGDLGLLLANWGLPGIGDFNFDGIVDGVDLGLLLAAW